MHLPLFFSFAVIDKGQKIVLVGWPDIKAVGKSEWMVTGCLAIWRAMAGFSATCKCFVFTDAALISVPRTTTTVVANLSSPSAAWTKRTSALCGPTLLRIAVARVTLRPLSVSTISLSFAAIDKGQKIVEPLSFLLAMVLRLLFGRSTAAPTRSSGLLEFWESLVQIVRVGGNVHLQQPCLLTLRGLAPPPSPLASFFDPLFIGCLIARTWLASLWQARVNTIKHCLERSNTRHSIEKKSTMATLCVI